MNSSAPAQPAQPKLKQSFMRRHPVWVVAGAIVTSVAVVAFLIVFAPYYREMRIAGAIKTDGGNFEYLNGCPKSFPANVYRCLPLRDRIHMVRFGLRMPSPETLKSVHLLERLQTLVIESQSFSDADLEYLNEVKTVRSFSLNQTQVTGTGFRHLGAMTQVEELNLSGSMITDAVFAPLQGMSKLLTLDLDQTQVTGRGFEELVGLSELACLSLDGTQVDDVGLEHLEGLNALGLLNLDNTKVSNSGLHYLKALKDLKFLTLPKQIVENSEEIQDLKSALPQLAILVDGKLISGHAE